MPANAPSPRNTIWNGSASIGRNEQRYLAPGVQREMRDAVSQVSLAARRMFRDERGDARAR